MLPGMQRYLIAGNFSNASKKGKFYLVYNLLGNECGAAILSFVCMHIHELSILVCVLLSIFFTILNRKKE